MKNIFYLLFLVSSLSIAQSKETVEHLLQKNGWFILDKIGVQVENNFISETDQKSHNAYTNLVNKEYYFNVYGEKVNLKIANARAYFFGAVYIDTVKKNKVLYNIENLELQIVKNNTVVKKWDLIRHEKKYLGSYFDGTKEYAENYYFPYTDSLVNGDKLIILLRKKGQETFLKLHIEKKESARKPFVISSRSQDSKSTKSLENFIQESLTIFHDDNSFDKSTFYNSWPEDFAPRIIGNSIRHFRGEKYCLVFRKPNREKRTFNSFEYRISINSKPAEWTNSNGIIFLDLNQAGTEYKLEVRYKNNPKYVSVYKCSTEPEWYQTVWFKITAGLLLLLIIIIIYLIWARKKTERNRLAQKSKIKMLYAQLNPHFIFNALSSIQGLLNDNQIEKANQYLSGFGSLLRNTLTSSESETIPLDIEIKTIKNYVELEQLRNSFLFHLIVDETIDLHNTQTLPLLMQPLIENGIKHGISNQVNGEITITISKKEKDLFFQLADNGKGFDTLAEQKGLGLKLVKDRITLFNQSSKKVKLSTRIESTSAGTQITILYKNWLNND